MPHLFLRKSIVRCGLTAAAIAALGLGGCVSCRMIAALSRRSDIRAGVRSPAKLDKAHLDVYGRIPILHLYGTPAEMGRQHGTLLKKSLLAFDAYIHGLLPKQTVAKILDAARVWEEHLPDELKQELKAMAEASTMPYIDLVALNVTPRLYCSALAVWGNATADGSMILGRNADYFGMGLEEIGGIVVVYHRSDAIPVLAVNTIGMIGAFTGVNGEGVAFGNLLELESGESRTRTDGIAIQLLLRMVAHRCRTAQEMCDFLRTQKHAIPMNVIAADRTTALVAELGIEKACIRQGERGVLAVANHFRSPEMVERPPRCPRYDSLTRSAEAQYGKFDPARMMQALHPARIRKINLQAAVFEPGAKRAYISVNRVPATRGPYMRLNLDEVFADTELRVTNICPDIASDPADTD